MILKTLDLFKTAVPTANAISHFEDVEIYIKSAELWTKNNVLGKDLYDIIDAAEFNDADLLQLCRNVIANYAYWDAIPFLDLTHTNQGFGVVQNNNLVPASKERVEKLRAQCIVRRDNEVENLIEFLLQNSAWHEAWKGSTVFDDMFSSLLPTLRIYRRYHDIQDRSTLEKLKGSIITVQNTWIADVISQVYVDHLVEAQKDDDFTPADNVIIGMLRAAVCKLSLAWGIEDMSVVLSSKGTVTMATTDSFVGSISDASRNASFSQTFKKAGDAMLDKVVNIMIDNLEAYPLFAGSKEYQARTEVGYANDTESTIFSSLF